MSLTRTLDDFHLSPTLSSLFQESQIALLFDVFDPRPTLSTSFLSAVDPAFDDITDVICLSDTPFSSHYRRISAIDELKQRSEALLNPISGLGLGADRFKEWDRKYTWKAEIKGETDRKYLYTAEIKGSEGGKCKWTAEIESPEKKYSWTTEMKGKKEGDAAKRHDSKGVAVKIKELGSHEEECSGGKGKTKGECSTRVVEIKEPDDLAATVLRKAFARRAGAVASLRGKRKILSPDEAALVIERTFRAYLIRRSKSLRALRELAVAKSKLKELRALFNNYSYRQSIARDSEEQQRFSERIISLILAVDAIQGTDIMVRGGRRSMLDEVEAMLDAIDPHPTGKLVCLKRHAV